MTRATVQERRRQAPVARILVRAADLLATAPGIAGAAAADIDAILATAPISIIPALDRAFRDAGLHTALGLRFLDLRPPDVERLERIGAATSGSLGVASLVRDGHAREAALRRLATRVDRISTGFLINRLNDYVGQIGNLAWAGLQPRLTPRHAGAVVRCLPLITRMSAWVRAGADQRHSLRELVRAPTSRHVLWDSSRDRDRELAFAACAELVDLYRGQPEIRDVLAAALARGDQHTRSWAGYLALNPAVTPPAVLQALIPTLELDRNPAIRLVAVRGRATGRDRDGLIRAAFDPHGLVRHHARVLLAGSFGAIDYRAHALAALTGAGASRSAVVGALATLSDFGRRADIPVVAAHVADPRGGVAREAQRTLGLLEQLP